MTRPTLRDVAEAAGVSTAAASVALRGLPGVSQATRQTVLDTAQRLGYVVNVSARNLRQQRTDLIGVYLPPGAQLQWYYAEFALGATDAAGERGVATIMLPQHVDPSGFLAHIDGIVTVDVTATDAHVRELLASGKPVVTGEDVPAGVPAPAGRVVVDHHRHMHEVLTHFVARGAHDIAVLLPPTDTVWGRQVNEAAAAFSAPGVAVRAVPVSFIPTADEISRVMSQFQEADAVLAVPDGTAVGVAGQLQDAQRTIGEQVLLASYTDTLPTQLFSPPITALDLRPRELGAQCARLLLELLRGNAPETRQLGKAAWQFRASTQGT